VIPRDSAAASCTTCCTTWTAWRWSTSARHPDLRGDNDTGGNPPIPNEAILDDLRQIIARIHAKLPQTRIYLLSIKPSVLRRARWPVAQQVNAGYKAIAAGDPLVYYVDVAASLLNRDGTVMEDIFVADNLHLNDLGNAIWVPPSRRR